MQVVQVVPRQRLPRTLHPGRGGRLRRGKTISYSLLFEVFFLTGSRNNVSLNQEGKAETMRRNWFLL